MPHTPAVHLRQFLVLMSVLALLAAVVDLALHFWIQAASSICVLIGVLAFRRSLRFHSIRWRTLAWMTLTLAVALQMVRVMT